MTMEKTDTTFLLVVSVVAALGGLLFGFDTAVISGTVPFIKTYFALDDIALGWAVSSLLIGCMAGVLASGKPADVLGRRTTLLAAAALFLVSAVGSALAEHLATFIAFRFIGGVAVGTASMLSPMYIAEISPAGKRGSLVSLNQLAIVIGILAAFFSNYLLVSTGDNNWRWMLSVMGVPAVLFFLALLFVPESPRWLVQKGRTAEGFAVLKRINGTTAATAEMAAIESTLVHVRKVSYRDVFTRQVGPILWIGIIVAVFQQITGINAIMYYAPMIFAKTGIGLDTALMQTIAVGGINFLFTIVAIRYIDKIGRRPLLIGGTIGMAAALIMLAAAFYFERFEGYLVLCCILFYIASFAASLGPVTWVFISEIYPNRLRSEAMSVTIVILWGMCFIVSLIFPYLLNVLGGGATFFVFGALCIAYLIFILLKIPETKGRSLEELEALLVRKSA
jgi:sugar porter (SP) family MFS transporter